MKIAIHAADLDSERIDGTRVYIYNVLKNLGRIAPDDNFLIYHKSEFNPKLTPTIFDNYQIKKRSFPFSWTQTAFAYHIWKDSPEAVWMPMHNLPFIRKSGMKTVVTIHDLAFKIFPEFFPEKDLRKLNFLANFAIKNADALIAVSHSTKNDILRFYPHTKEDKIKVIYHGFDGEVFQKETPSNLSEQVLSKFKIQNSKFVLYVGAIQPRKNIPILIEAFEKVKEKNPDLKLVLAGDKAWMWEEVFERIENSPHRNDIVITGKISFEEMAIFYKKASLYIFPSLYEGFGIPLLEAFASETPVIAANNSSLPEVGGDAALYFDAKNPKELSEKIEAVLQDEDLRANLARKGLERVKVFSWDKCARQTLDFIKGK